MSWKFVLPTGIDIPNLVFVKRLSIVFQDLNIIDLVRDFILEKW